MEADDKFFKALSLETRSSEENKSILEEALQIVDGGRGYEPPTKSLPHIASLASGITRKDITAKDVTAVLIALKLSRESFAHKRDNLVDACGYLHILQMLNDAKID